LNSQRRPERSGVSSTFCKIDALNRPRWRTAPAIHVQITTGLFPSTASTVIAGPPILRRTRSPTFNGMVPNGSTMHFFAINALSVVVVSNSRRRCDGPL